MTVPSGADLLATHSESDSTLLRLRRDPPPDPSGGRWFSGWDAGEASRPTSIFGVHHPRGDLKKYATGTAESRPFCLNDGHGGCGQNVPYGLGVLWSQGVVEGGSSGSGLFSFEVGGRLRGVLSGSPAGCSEQAVYGSLAGFFPHARRWLAVDSSPPPPSDDHSDTADEATRVALGASTQGHLESPGDIDYFRFEISVAGTLRVYTTGDTDTYGNLWGNNQWLDWDDDDGDGYNFRIEWSVSPGTYFIRVRGYDEDSTTGQYTLVVRFTPTPRDDHPDTADEATRVALGSSTEGHLESPGDIDYFRFEVSVAGTLTVYTTGNTDTHGSLWGNAQWLDWDDDDGDGYNFRIEWSVSPGTYFIRVRGYDEDSTTGQYTLVVRFTPNSGGRKSTLDFSITDSCNDGQAIRYRFFEDAGDISQSSAAWPSWDRAYVAEVYGETYISRLACTPGYKVCFGARTGNGYWGVDIDANESCESCCTRCPTSGRASFSRNLVCE